MYRDATPHKHFAPAVVGINKFLFPISCLQVIKTHLSLDAFLIALVWLILFPLLIFKAHLFQEILLGL